MSKSGKWMQNPEKKKKSDQVKNHEEKSQVGSYITKKMTYLVQTHLTTYKIELEVNRSRQDTHSHIDICSFRTKLTEKHHNNTLVINMTIQKLLLMLMSFIKKN